MLTSEKCCGTLLVQVLVLYTNRSVHTNTYDKKVMLLKSSGKMYLATC